MNVQETLEVGTKLFRDVLKRVEIRTAQVKIPSAWKLERFDNEESENYNNDVQAHDFQFCVVIEFWVRGEFEAKT